MKKLQRKWCVDVPYWPHFQHDYDHEAPTIVFRTRRFRFGPMVPVPPPIRQSFGRIKISGTSRP